MIQSSDPETPNIAPPVRHEMLHEREFDLISDSTLYGRQTQKTGRPTYWTNDMLRTFTGLPNVKILQGKIGGTMTDLITGIRQRILEHGSRQRTMPVLLVTWSANEYDWAP